MIDPTIASFEHLGPHLLLLVLMLELIIPRRIAELEMRRQWLDQLGRSADWMRGV